MLILTRRPGDFVMIADDVEVRVLSIVGNTVRIGFRAPDRVRIVRGELLHNAAPSTHLAETDENEVP
jgi:carbon storage regulator